jgi:hypothetical protein
MGVYVAPQKPQFSEPSISDQQHLPIQFASQIQSRFFENDANPHMQAPQSTQPDLTVYISEECLSK